MPSFNQSGKVHAGQKSTISVAGGAAAPVPAVDTLTIHGITRTIQEWIRRGVLRTATVSGNTVTYAVEHNPESV